MKNLLLAAAALGFLGVALGAFGAHALRDSLSPEMMRIYEKAVLYHFVHVLAILAAALLFSHFPTQRYFRYTGWLFAAGVILFSGSLYFYSCTGQKIFAMVTPIGGLLFLLGWLSLFYAAARLSIRPPA